MLVASLGVAAAVAASLVGCDEPAPPSEVPPPAAVEETFDRGAYCRASCERAVKCSAEAARTLAAKGTKEDLEVIEEATAESPTVTRACVTTCEGDAHGAPPPSTRDLRRAERCLGELTCDAFGACLRALEPAAPPG